MRITAHEKKMIREISQEIKTYKNFLLTTHQTPDGDGIGCELAFLRLLKKLGKNAIVVNENLSSSVYEFLPGYNDIIDVDEYAQMKFSPDVIIVFDCSLKDRIGKLVSFFPVESKILNIDHHDGNTFFGDINWVCPSCSSVGEMCFFIAHDLESLDNAIAECLYVAILTDTGSFRHHFDLKTIKVVSELIRAGINPEQIADNVYNNNSLACLKLLGHALISIEYDSSINAAWTILYQDTFKKTGAVEQDTEIVIDTLRTIEHVDFVFLVKERKNEVKFSLRSRKGVNVRKIAEMFGGGGHDNAAGFSLKDITVTEALEQFLKKLKARTCDGKNKCD